jgi:lysozyme family protein
MSAALAAENVARWKRARITRDSEVVNTAQKLLANKERYRAVQAKTGVPWWVVAVIHSRESSGNFLGILHNGERIIGTGKLTTLVPAGRGPFATWEAAAVDALTNAGPRAASNTDWSLSGMLLLLERYNGLGYFNRGLPSPYIWAGTDQYTAGKFVADGKFDMNHIDQQIGCAPLLMMLEQLDPSIVFEGGNPAKQPGSNVSSNGSAGSTPSIWAVIGSFIAKLFGKKG